MLALAIHLALSASAHPAPRVSWQVAPELRCPTVAQLKDEFETYVASLPQGDQPDFAGEARAEIVVGPKDSMELHLSIASPPLALQRELVGVRAPTQGAASSNANCQEIAHTASILVAAWLLELKESTAEPPPPPPPAPIVAAAPAVTQQAPPPPPANHAHLALSLGGGAVVGQGDPAGAASIGLELRLPPLWGIGLQASWIGNMTVSDEPFGSMQLHRQLYAAYLAMRIPPLQRALHEVLEVRPYLGPLLWHGSAQSYGYETNLAHDQLIPGLTAGILMDLHIFGPIFASLQVGAVGLVQSVSYTVTHPDGAQVVLTDLGQWAFQASLAVGAQVF
jgi:hypothetical protein